MNITIYSAAICLFALCLSAFAQEPGSPATASVEVRLDQPAKAISPDLWGIFFEDLSHAADGGLYAEMVQNRSFDFGPTDRTEWTALSFWETIQRDGGKGWAAIDASWPIHPNNPQYAILHIDDPRGDVGLANAGFDGIPVREGESYDVSLFARHLFSGGRWDGNAAKNDPKAAQLGRPALGAIVVRIESRKGEVIAESSLDMPGKEWTKLSTNLIAKKTDPDCRLLVLANFRGAIALDMVSMFPKKTFKNRANGLRADLAQTVADLKPKFMRFPGGCLVHGNGLPNMYRWKDTIGPIETRRGQPNLWGYHQSVGLGYYEFFQFCEDIGAKPLPVVPAGVCCQNAGFTGGFGQRGLPMDQMDDYIQEVLDLIEWANGPADSKWGSKRAAAGHPEPFGLQYLGVGNEEHITPVFKERFKMIYDAVKAKHPEITVIGTVGPAPAGPDYEEGWKIASELAVPMVDEHYYESPEWFIDHQERYDRYDRSKSKVYIGEYASRGNSVGNAIAEAAYMTSLERNGDIVHLASYAPMLAKHRHINWAPDLIFFDNLKVFPTVNYYVQQLFCTNAGDAYWNTTVTQPDKQPKAISASAVKDANGDLIVKIVNTTEQPISANMKLTGGAESYDATISVLSGEARLVNPGIDRPRDNVAPAPIVPQTQMSRLKNGSRYDAPAHSLTVLRLKAAK